MELTAWCDANGAPTGLVTVTFDACETEADAAAVAGLLLPASAFFVPEEIERVQKVGEEYRFVLRDGTELTLDGAGAPRSLRAAAVTLEVVWIEWAQTMDRTSLRCVEK